MVDDFHRCNQQILFGSTIEIALCRLFIYLTLTVKLSVIFLVSCIECFFLFTDDCLRELAFHIIFHKDFPQKCNVPEECARFVNEGSSFGWALSHR